eukprot:2319746-Rhodomonas_salina.3
MPVLLRSVRCACQYEEQQPVLSRRVWYQAPAKFLDEDDDFPGPINLLPKVSSYQPIYALWYRHVHYGTDTYSLRVDQLLSTSLRNPPTHEYKMKFVPPYAKSCWDRVLARRRRGFYCSSAHSPIPSHLLATPWRVLADSASSGYGQD